MICSFEQKDFHSTVSIATELIWATGVLYNNNVGIKRVKQRGTGSTQNINEEYPAM